MVFPTVTETHVFLGTAARPQRIQAPTKCLCIHVRFTLLLHSTVEANRYPLASQVFCDEGLMERVLGFDVVLMEEVLILEFQELEEQEPSTGKIPQVFIFTASSVKKYLLVLYKKTHGEVGI